MVVASRMTDLAAAGYPYADGILPEQMTDGIGRRNRTRQWLRSSQCHVVDRSRSMPQTSQLRPNRGRTHPREHRLGQMLPPLQVSAEFVLMVVKVGEGGVNLPQRKVGMLGLQLTGVPIPREMLGDEFDDFHRRSGDHRHAIGGEIDMRIDNCWHVAPVN
jgi:hypothetical protein